MLLRTIKTMSSRTRNLVTTIRNNQRQEMPDLGLRLNPQMKRRLQKIVNEIGQLRLSGAFSSDLETKNWIEMLDMKLRSQRLRYLRRLPLTNCDDKQGPTVQVTSIFLPVLDVARFYENNLVHAMFFGQTVVVDMGFERWMQLTQISTLVNDLGTILKENRERREPFNIVFCNFDDTQETFFKFRRRLSQIGLWTPSLQTMSASYLDVYPRERLVYLTPDATEDVVINHNHVYILGGLVEREYAKPRTLKKATVENVRTARLPRKLKNPILVLPEVIRYLHRLTTEVRNETPEDEIRNEDILNTLHVSNVHVDVNAK